MYLPNEHITPQVTPYRRFALCTKYYLDPLKAGPGTNDPDVLSHLGYLKVWTSSLPPAGKDFNLSFLRCSSF